MRVIRPSSRRASAGLPSLKAARLHPRGVEILHLVARDDAAAEAADAREIPGARDIAGLREGAGRREPCESEQQQSEWACGLVRMGHGRTLCMRGFGRCMAGDSVSAGCQTSGGPVPRRSECDRLRRRYPAIRLAAGGAGSTRSGRGPHCSGYDPSCAVPACCRSAPQVSFGARVRPRRADGTPQAPVIAVDRNRGRRSRGKPPTQQARPPHGASVKPGNRTTRRLRHLRRGFLFPWHDQAPMNQGIAHAEISSGRLFWRVFSRPVPPRRPAAAAISTASSPACRRKPQAPASRERDLAGARRRQQDMAC